MRKIFKRLLCRHPFYFISVHKKSTRTKRLDLRYAEMIGSVEDFLDRGRKQLKSK